MNVLQTNRFYHPHIGGIECVVRDIAVGLPESYSASVLAATPKGRGNLSQQNGVKVQKTTSLGVVLSVPIAPTFPFHLQRAIHHVDVVHHHLPNPLAVVSQLFVSTGDTPIVATYHSDIVRQSRSLSLYRPILTQFLAKADCIMVTSQRLLDNSDILSSYQHKCTVVPLSIDLSAVDNQIPPQIDIDVDHSVILFVGRLNYYKGVEYLVDAMSYVDGTLLVAGDGGRRSELERRAQDLGVTERVRFLGSLSDEELASAYQLADVFVLPSVEPSEAFGIVQLEAMARGLPVVNTSLPTGVPWVSIDGQTGLTVPPRDSTALAGAIQTLLDDEDLRLKYGRQARTRVENLFTREKMLAKVVNVYESVINEKE